MITLRLGKQYNDPKQAKELAEAIVRNPGSCDNVWFTTQFGFPTLETHKAYAKSLQESAKIFRNAGIGVSIQIANTFGHGERVKNHDCSGLVFDGSPAELMVGPKGKSHPY